VGNAARSDRLGTGSCADVGAGQSAFSPLIEKIRPNDRRRLASQRKQA
jgi:hypothetical protein